MPESCWRCSTRGGPGVNFYAANGATLQLKLNNAYTQQADGSPRLLPLETGLSGSSAASLASLAHRLQREGRKAPLDRVAVPEAGGPSAGWGIRLIACGPETVAVTDYYYHRVLLVTREGPASAGQPDAVR